MNIEAIKDLLNTIGNWCVGLMILSAILRGILLSIHGRTK